jgi:adenylyltransferase/sulfurtransferase
MNDETLLIDDDDRYSRLRLIPWWDQQRLAQSRILVVGAGALGNEVLKNLALVGVGQLYIVDCDRIEQSNLTRSVLFRRNDVGRPKAAAAAAMLQDLNPDIRVKAWHADVLTDIGLGLFRTVDVVIGCLDNREARLWVNRQCWKVNTPWIDGGIQEINGVVKVFVPPHSACYECAMTENDYRLINLRYSCPLLRQEDLQAGKVPTAPTIASMIGGLQAQEALKLIHGVPVEAGAAFIYNGSANRSYKTRFQRRPECLSHETYPTPRAVALQAASTARELFDVAATTASLTDGAPRRICLDRDLVVAMHCPTCGEQRPILQPLSRVGLGDACCQRCGQTAKPQIEHVIDEQGPLADLPLQALGLAPYDIVRVEGSQGEEAFLLAGDGEQVL